MAAEILILWIVIPDEIDAVEEELERRVNEGWRIVAAAESYIILQRG